ncbi:DEAD/DEAH box helicase [Luteipulveratus halotolerans]|uniref:Helicase ATP-binding domain-containing protein n=1 Tax=Luteipulveratus halotolerans TaxID=1631356 RepID=A0A0L6CM29_9MICO|nr:hypothetical protein [Luteipulveratus halotolerans]KNX38856.1 hypothetical protein VV01_19720 [Luteipulveratus halotolerans]
MSELPAFDAAAVTTNLTDFQRRTVRHVMNRFHHDDQRSRRFLVADETGLGKSIVARGVIAETIAHLENDPAIDRIDIVYVCSNADLAKQNLGRLNVTGERDTAFSSRLTLLAKHSHALNDRSTRRTRKPVNLVSFTPGTSFDHGYQTGKAEERAMLAVLLIEILRGGEPRLPRSRERAVYLLLRGGVSSWKRFEGGYVRWLREELGDAGADPRILKEFARQMRKSPVGSGTSLLTRVKKVIDKVDGRYELPTSLKAEAAELTGEMRAMLARCSVETLEPDLIILDEFQRFRGLLDPGSAQGELAHHLFDHKDARVLLLSATPYKPFTYGEEDENHADDFYELLRFLSRSDEPVLDVDEVKAGFAAYREAVRFGRDDITQVRVALGGSLRQVMSRWDRPAIPDHAGTTDRARIADKVTAADLTGYVALQRAADLVSHERDHGLITPEYWKSAPYFASFCQGYRLATRLHDERPDADVAKVRAALAGAQSIDPNGIRRFAPLDPGGARMRTLVEDTLDQGWWRFLWMPPSLPYVQPGGVYADERARTMTKRLLFSSWTATPSAVAAVLSYEAERRMAEGTSYTENTTEARARIPQGLAFPVRDGTPGRMSSLLMMWPLTRLSELGDPRSMARAGGAPISPADAIETVRARLRAEHASVSQSEHDGETADDAAMPPSVWRAAFSDARNWVARPLEAVRGDEVLSDGVRLVVDGLTGGAATSPSDDEPADPGVDDASRRSGLERHIRLAATVFDQSASPSDADLDVLARMALFAPGCVSLRVVRRLVEASASAVSDVGVHAAAAELATGLRSLFNRPDVTKLIDPRGDTRPYWSHVLSYIADGNLEAVLDEWLFHVWADGGSRSLDDESLRELVEREAARISLRSQPYQALDMDNLDQPIPMSVGFALRYGARQATADGDARQPEVRAAFNSPFWPFVLASTSVGQEGIDFHWWCHAIFHWNTPANPVDFEQREGRVDRFRGHAVRKNIAATHGSALLADGVCNPWARAYDVAVEHRAQYGDFTPDWVYPGPARIERHVAPLAFSTDGARYDNVRRDVAYYRLALGQPRQEDLVNALRERELSDDEASALRIDLTPG